MPDILSKPAPPSLNGSEEQARGENFLHIKWTATSNAVRYRIKCSAYFQEFSGAAIPFQATFSNLLQNEKYLLTVVAIASDGVLAESDVFECWTRPAPPSDLFLVAGESSRGSDHIVLSWAPVLGIPYYQVIAEPGNHVKEFSPPPPNGHIFGELSANTQYRFAVRSVDPAKGGHSLNTSPILNTITRPPRPKRPSVAVQRPNYVTLSWETEEEFPNSDVSGVAIEFFAVYSDSEREKIHVSKGISAGNIDYFLSDYKGFYVEARLVALHENFSFWSEASIFISAAEIIAISAGTIVDRTIKDNNKLSHDILKHFFLVNNEVYYEAPEDDDSGGGYEDDDSGGGYEDDDSGGGYEDDDSGEDYEDDDSGEDYEDDDSGEDYEDDDSGGMGDEQPSQPQDTEKKFTLTLTIKEVHWNIPDGGSPGKIEGFPREISIKVDISNKTVYHDTTKAEGQIGDNRIEKTAKESISSEKTYDSRSEKTNGNSDIINQWNPREPTISAYQADMNNREEKNVSAKDIIEAAKKKVEYPGASLETVKKAHEKGMPVYLQRYEDFLPKKKYIESASGITEKILSVLDVAKIAVDIKEYRDAKEEYGEDHPKTFEARMKGMDDSISAAAGVITGALTPIIIESAVGSIPFIAPAAPFIVLATPFIALGVGIYLDNYLEKSSDEEINNYKLYYNNYKSNNTNPPYKGYLEYEREYGTIIERMNIPTQGKQTIPDGPIIRQR